MAEKRDYSPVDEPAPGEAQQARERRKRLALLGGAHLFWVYALVLAAVILLVIYLTGGFGEGAE